jgi:hypothetical protein
MNVGTCEAHSLRRRRSIPQPQGAPLRGDPGAVTFDRFAVKRLDDRAMRQLIPPAPHLILSILFILSKKRHLSSARNRAGRGTSNQQGVTSSEGKKIASSLLVPSSLVFPSSFVPPCSLLVPRLPFVPRPSLLATRPSLPLVRIEIIVHINSVI